MDGVQCNISIASSVTTNASKLNNITTCTSERTKSGGLDEKEEINKGISGFLRGKGYVNAAYLFI